MENIQVYCFERFFMYSVRGRRGLGRVCVCVFRTGSLVQWVMACFCGYFIVEERCSRKGVWRLGGVWCRRRFCVQIALFVVKQKRRVFGGVQISIWLSLFVGRISLGWFQGQEVEGFEVGIVDRVFVLVWEIYCVCSRNFVFFCFVFVVYQFGIF